jgi:hypothetical protein
MPARPVPRLPVSLTVSPGGAILPVGDLTGSLRVVVSNTGTGTVTVVVTKTAITSTARSAGCSKAAPPSWLTVTPGVMHLAPRQSGYALMTVHAPKSLTGTVDVVAVFTASGVKIGSHNVSADDSVGAQLVVRGTGRPAPVPRCGKQVPKALPYHPPASAGFPILPVALAVVALLAVLAGLRFTLMRRRRRA